MRQVDVPLLIEAEGIGKRFKGAEKDAVSDITFAVEPGRIFGMVGPSGGGKTTIIRMLNGVYRPSSGNIKVFGHDPTRFRRIERESIGYLPQNFVLYPELSVSDNLSFVAGLFGVIGNRRSERMKEVLDFVELTDAKDRPASKLSGGMKRRLGLAAALLHEPVLLFVDEPTAGIDPVLRAKFWERFRLLRDQGVTIFLTTQYVTEAEYCDRLAVLRDGKLVAIGTPNDIRREAVGGEAIELEVDQINRSALGDIERIPGVQRVTAISPEVAHLIVDNADATIPEINAVIERSGMTITRLDRRQVNYDEVFVLLMEKADEPDDSDSIKAA